MADDKMKQRGANGAKYGNVAAHEDADDDITTTTTRRKMMTMKMN